MRCALTEVETREEVMREMEERMRIMEEKYSRRLMSEVSFHGSVQSCSLYEALQLKQNELKTDAKIDMLHRAGLFGSPIKTQRQVLSDEEEEEAADVEMNLVRSWYLSIGH